MAAIPKNNALVAHYGSRGVVLLGIHDANRGTEKIPQIIAQRNITYPVAVDQGGTSARAWKVSFWPTYAVLDRNGIVRAIGLDPGSVEKVVERLLAEAGAQDQREWLEGSAVNRRRLKELAAGETPPPLRARDWTNTTPLKLEELKGNVVLLNFWTPSRRACIRALRRDIELHEQYADEGLVIIAVCRAPGRRDIAGLVDRLEIPYPVCTDVEMQTTGAYRVNNYPDYYLIDRAGKLRIADCKDAAVEDAVKYLLAEPPPKPEHDEPAEQASG